MMMFMPPSENISFSIETDFGPTDFLVKLVHCLTYIFGPGSSVGIATDYGLDRPGSNPGGDEIFRPFRPVMGSTQPPVK